MRAGIGPGPFPTQWWAHVDEGRLERIGALFASLDADVVALQEVAVLTADGILHDNAGMLAARTGMQHRYAATRHFAIHDADGRQLGAGLFGNALLSRIPIRTARTLALPMATDDASVEPPGADHPLAGVRYADAPASTREPRCLLIAEVELPAGAPATIGSVHLSHIGSGERALQAAACVRALSQVEGPVVLAGDLNAAIDSTELKILRDGWTDAFGVAEIAAGDERRATTEDGAAIDHIFVRGAVVLDCRRVDEAGWLSDHLPLLAELEIRTTTLDARQIGYEDS